MQLNQVIDHTLLKPTATVPDIVRLCKEAVQHNFYAVCVNGSFVELAKGMLQDTDIKIAAVVGFPLGASSTEVKVFEATECDSKGADEIDMVINIGLLKSGKNIIVEKEIAAVKKGIGSRILKVIIETGYFTENEKRIACRAAMNAGADFVKTSTGFGPGGATLEDIKLMKDEVGDKLQIKASGGIKDAKTALKMLQAGASRIGTSSGIEIVTNSIYKHKENI